MRRFALLLSLAGAQLVQLYFTASSFLNFFYIFRHSNPRVCSIIFFAILKRCRAEHLIRTTRTRHFDARSIGLVAPSKRSSDTTRSFSFSHLIVGSTRVEEHQRTFSKSIARHASLAKLIGRSE